MISNVSYENTNMTIHQLNESFSGRIGTPQYDSRKLVHIHRRNRPYVWNLDMQTKLLDSVLQGYYVPPIICSHSIVDSVERREVMEGGNRITTFRRILNDEVRPLTLEERMKIQMSSITVVVMRGLTPKQQREMFRRLNKNIKVSDGQLYSMSEDDSPLVKEAFALLNADDHPLRQLITKHFFDTRNADNDGKKQLENAVALISGAIHGPNYISKSYNVQETKVESQEPIHRKDVVSVLKDIIDIFELADQKQPLNDSRKRRAQWNVGKLLGAMLYDYHTSESDGICQKWATYIAMVRRYEIGAEEAVKMAGAQNLTATRYKRICVKVDIYVRERRLASDLELASVVHHHSEPEIEETDEDEDA
jgi:hypothetical protein